MKNLRRTLWRSMLLTVLLLSACVVMPSAWADEAKPDVGAQPTGTPVHVGPSVPIPWLLGMVIVMFLYLGTAAWVDRDAHHLGMKAERWNLPFAILMAAQGLLFWITPVWIALPAGIIAYAVMLQKYVHSRNLAVIDRDKVFTREHLRVVLRRALGKVGIRRTEAQRIESAMGEHVPVILTDASGKLVSAGDRLDKDKSVQQLKDILAQAQGERVREVHLVPSGSGVKVFSCIDGVLHSRGELERQTGVPMLQHVRELVPNVAGPGDIEEDLPRFALDFPLSRRRVLTTVHEVEMDGRVHTIMRLHDPTRKTPGFEQLGMPTRLLAEMRRMCDANDGMIVLAGPRGSGCRTTTYALMEWLDAFTRNIGTVEAERPRRKLQNIVQERPGQSPERSVQAILTQMFKQDYNVVMVEGVTDAEAMRFCVESARSEHLMIVGLEAPDAGTVLGGLLKLGQPQALAEALRVIVSQRLVRVLCPQCRRPVTPDDETMRMLSTLVGGAEVTVHQEAGCQACGKTGFAGRTAIFEYFPVKDAVKSAITKGASVGDVMAAARGTGYVTLMQSAMAKVARGTTSLQEVNRVLGEH